MPRKVILSGPTDAAFTSSQCLNMNGWNLREKEEKQKALEAKWAEEDRIYAEKQAAKEQRKLQRERERKRKQLERLDRKYRRERILLEKYIQQERARGLKKKTKRKA